MTQSEKFEKELQRLNPQQRNAVETIDGPVMVVAGPGTGKTQILALRIANILNKTDVLPENILCVTFTEAGVQAMRERLTSFIGTDAYKVTISTFHGFANSVIQDYPEKFAFASDLKQLDELTRIKIIRTILDEHEELNGLRPFYNRYSKADLITKAIQTLKQEGIVPQELLQRTIEAETEHIETIEQKNGKTTKKDRDFTEKLQNLKELVTVYEAYQNQLLEKGLYDYEDMILYVGQKFREDDALLAQYQERFLYIHVDEFQDTNGAQNDIITLLGNFDASPNIFVVGDDDQAIYRFQGANLENILSFTTTFQNVTTILTPINYRSTQTILDIADSLISHNENRLVNRVEQLNKKLQAFNKEKGTRAEFHTFDNSDEELIFVSKEIKKLYEAGVSYDDVAILYRKNAHSEEINHVLQTFGIPTKVNASKSLFSNELVQKVIDLFTITHLYSKTVDEQLYRVLLFDFLHITTHVVYRFTKNVYEKRASFTESFLQLADESVTVPTSEDIQMSTGTESDSNMLQNFANLLLTWHRKSANMSITKLFNEIIKESGLLSYITNITTIQNQTGEESKDFNDVLAIISFNEFLKQQESLNPHIRLSELLQDIALIKENKIPVSVSTHAKKMDAVSLLTAHGSKGLEFKYVFIVRASQNNWGSTRRQPTLLIPHVYTDFTETHDDTAMMLEDERRLFFVAITRAKEKVYVTYSKEYESNGTVSSVAPSQFIQEINPELLHSVTSASHDISVNDSLLLLTKPNEESYSEQETEFLTDAVSHFALSPSALNAYLASPKKFKEEYLIHIPKLKSKEMALGTSIHYAIERVNRFLLKTNDVSAISLDQMIEHFTFCLEREFIGDELFGDTLSEGKKILTEYYNFYIATGNYALPVEAEYNFSSHHVMLPLAEGEPVRLKGKIDKVEMIDKSRNTVKIVDYKTARPQSDNYVKGATKASDGSYWRQLVFYALLADLDNQFRPQKKFTESKYLCEQVEIDFLRSEKGKFRKSVFAITEQDKKDLIVIINDVMKRIRNLEYPEKLEIEV